VKFSDEPMTRIKCFDSTNQAPILCYYTAPLDTHQHQATTWQNNIVKCMTNQ